MVKYNFCPKCGNKATQDGGVVTCKHCGHVIYIHSAATGSVFVVKNAKVMMGKRKDDPQKGTWDIPGGFLNYGEHPEDGAKRELKEETGVDIKLIKLLGVYMDKYMFQGETLRTLNFIYVGSIKSGEPNPSDDVEEIKWFDIAKPIPNIAFPLIEKGLKDLRKWYKTGRGRVN